MNKDKIMALDNGNYVEFSYEQLLEFHGGLMPGGVALAYRMFKWVFEDVLKQVPERGNCMFYTGLGQNGRGIVDTAKMVLGVVENESLRMDIEYSLDKMGPKAPGGGRYYFEVGCKDQLVKLAVRDGAIPDEFFACSAKMHRKKQAGEVISEEEVNHLQELRISLSEAILVAKASDLFVQI